MCLDGRHGCDRRRHSDALLWRHRRRALRRLLVANLPKEFRIPPLADIGVRLYSVHQRGLAQMTPSAFDESELHVIASAAFPLNDIFSQGPDVVWDIHRFKLRVVANALKEWDAEPRA